MKKKTNQKEICVTGSNGFIGSTLCDYLQADKKAFFRWNRLKQSDLGECSTVIHLAARVHQMIDMADDPGSEFRAGNRDLTVNLAKQALKQGVDKFIYISSVKVVGEKPGIYDLNDSCQPTDPYGCSKKEAEDELRKLFKGHTSAKCIILRLPMVYGPGNMGNMLSLLKAASRKIILPLGFARAKRSMINVKNVCDAILTIQNDASPNRPDVQTYFLSDGNDLSAKELYSSIFQNMHNRKGVFPFPESVFRFLGRAGSIFGKIIKKKLPLNKDVISRLFDEYCFSSSVFCKDYMWTPVVTPEEGIKETVDWYLAACQTEKKENV